MAHRDFAARLAIAVCCLLLLLLPGGAGAQSRSAAEVVGLRFGVNDAVTRVVLDVDAASRFATRVLQAPPRLVIELENVRWRIRDHPQARPVGLARTVNYGNLDAGRGRLVIDVARPFRILRQDRLAPSGDIRHHRIIVDLVAVEPGTPAPAPPATSVAEASLQGPPPAARGAAAATLPAGPAANARSSARSADPPPPNASQPIAGPPRPRPAPTAAALAETAAAATAELDQVALAATAAPTEPAAGSTGTEDVAAQADAARIRLPLLGTNNHHPPAALPRAEDVAATPANGDRPVPDGAGETGAADETVLALAPVQAAPPFPARRRVIALDPGHGGIDPGTVGINGVLEKEVTLDLARRLERLILDTGRFDVVLTREADVFVSLRDRMAKARRADASLFISIHADSLGDARFRGASVYTLSDDASDSEAARLARKENRADIIAGTDLSEHDQTVASILIDLAQRVTNNKSIAFADVLTSELADVTPLVRNTRRYAGFVVLKSPDVPSVLLELGYLSNETDAANLARPEYRDQLARATLRAIDRHFADPDATL